MQMYNFHDIRQLYVVSTYNDTFVLLNNLFHVWLCKFIILM